MQYDIEPTSMTNIMVKWYKNSLKHSTVKYSVFLGAKSLQPQKKKPWVAPDRLLVEMC